MKIKEKVQEKKKLIYNTKLINIGNKKYRIISQNKNGQCPLISIINCLLLRNKINVTNLKTVSDEYLIQLLMNYILEIKSDDIKDFNIEKIIETIPKLQKGINVNVIFKEYVFFNNIK